MEVINSVNLLSHDSQPQNTQSRCSMVQMERTAGCIPSYDSFTSQSKALSQDEAFEKLVREQLAEEDDTYALTTSNAQNGEDRFELFDFLDMVNPLQHIPVVNYVYRHLTGDNIKPISSVIGGAVFGGPVGAVSGLVTAMVEQGTGKSFPDAVLSFASENKSYEVASYEKTSSSYIDANYVYNV